MRWFKSVYEVYNTLHSLKTNKMIFEILYHNKDRQHTGNSDKSVIYEVQGMTIERISTNIDLHGKPKNGTQAYSMLINSLKQEIKEKQDVLHYLLKDNIKEAFINGYY